MGMFDTLTYDGRYFQTKDFDCTMTHYYLEGGRLLRTVGHTEDHSSATKWKTEHPGEPLPQELEGLLGMCGCLKWVETGREDMNFRGVVNFYGDDNPSEEWEEYNAKFTDGQLVELKRDSGEVATTDTSKPVNPSPQSGS